MIEKTGLRNAFGWPMMRFLAWEDQDGRCQLCGQYTRLSQCVAHHVINRKDGGKDTRANAVMRCQSCEENAHKKFANGNPISVKTA